MLKFKYIKQNEKKTKQGDFGVFVFLLPLSPYIINKIHYGYLAIPSLTENNERKKEIKKSMSFSRPMYHSMTTVS